jgi:2-octaprenyl-6-methoxyphenol hydroxylase
MREQPDCEQFDVVIVGGGLVGASLATAMAGSALRLALIEATPYQSPAHASFDDRSTALSASSRALLEQLGLWAALSREVAPIRVIHVSDQGHLGRTRLTADELGVEALGYVAPNRALGAALGGAIASQDNLRLFVPARVGGLEQDADGVSLRLDGGRKRLRTRLLVAADGVGSPVRKRLGLRVSEHDYQQVALVANVRAARRADGRAFERFTAEGPLAMLPLPDGAWSLVWTMSPAQASRRASADDGELLADLQRAFGYRLGRLERIGTRSSYPLRLQRVSEPTLGRVVVIGNACRTIHPVAGQGFNLALRDVSALAARLKAAAEAGTDPGSGELLAAYRAERAPDEGRVVSVTDALVRVFSTANPLLAAGRNLGLLALDALPSLRRRVAVEGMGLAALLRAGSSHR